MNRARVVAVVIGSVLAISACSESSTDAAPQQTPGVGGSAGVDGSAGADGSGGTDEPSLPFSTTGAPRQVEPLPGLMLASPAVLQLGPQQTGQISVARVDADALPSSVAPAELTWTSSDPLVAQVDSSGRVTPTGAGTAVVQVSDGSGRSSSVAVEVAFEPFPAVPVALHCSTPVLTAAVGEEATLNAIVTGPDGQALTGSSGIQYEVRGSADATVSADGVVRAARAGVAIVSAKRGVGPSSQELAGECVIAFSAAGATASAVRDKAACGNPRGVAYCSIIEGPGVMSSAGLSAPLRVTVFRGTDCEFGENFTVEVGSPTEVRLGIQGVVDIGSSGLLVSIGPGVAAYRAFVDGEPCDTRPAHAYVGIDPGGTWTGSCDNGDRGTLTVSNVPPYVVTRSGTWGVTETTATGCFENPDDGFSCGGPALVGASPELPPGYTEGSYRCTEAAPCNTGLGVSSCHDQREPVIGREDSRALITGPDSFISDSCRYTRGGTPMQCAAPGLSLANVTVQGQSYQVTSDEPPSGAGDISCTGTQLILDTSGGLFIIYTEFALAPGTYPVDFADASGFGLCGDCGESDCLSCSDGALDGAACGSLTIDSVETRDSINGTLPFITGSFAVDLYEYYGRSSAEPSCGNERVTGSFEIFCNDQIE